MKRKPGGSKPGGSKPEGPKPGGSKEDQRKERKRLRRHRATSRQLQDRRCSTSSECGNSVQRNRARLFLASRTSAVRDNEGEPKQGEGHRTTAEILCRGVACGCSSLQEQVP
ncbi:hypothetical protein PUN28_006706 [Cardiocondyla obscurior]|uniref:Uncharacterized protein n=1 Tax=Cardiocondyla obscurior TaxID=286306 RepID=A0AAW2G2G9_9HYME